MNTSAAVTLVASALTIGCAAATGPQFLPDVINLSRTSNAYVDVGSIYTERELQSTVSSVLARFGYFITDRRPSGHGVHLMSDWKSQPISQSAIFDGVQQARTRLIVDARRRGEHYAVTIFAVSFLQDASGTWREAVATPDLLRHVRDIGTQVEASR